MKLDSFDGDMILLADGNEGMTAGSCSNRDESSPMNTKSRSLVLQNYFPTDPNITVACSDNSAPLISMIKTCHKAAGERWPNFIAVDFYQVLHCCILYVSASSVSEILIFQ